MKCAIREICNVEHVESLPVGEERVEGGGDERHPIVGGWPACRVDSDHLFSSWRPHGDARAGSVVASFRLVFRAFLQLGF